MKRVLSHHPYSNSYLLGGAPGDRTYVTKVPAWPWALADHQQDWGSLAEISII